MAVVLYQRSEPRQKEWLPLLSQQIRLRNITQIILVNSEIQEGEIYFTLHISPLSAPFFTSSKVPMSKVIIWPEIQASLCSARLSAMGCIIRIWTALGKPLLSWAVMFQGLHYLGHHEEWNPTDFKIDTIIFTTPYGAFTSLKCLICCPVEPQRFLQIKDSTSENPPRPSYTLKNLVALHRLQRSVLEEHEIGEKHEMEIGIHGFGIESRDKIRKNPLLMSERLIKREKTGKKKIILKEEISNLRMKVNCLHEEKGRAEGRVNRLRKEAASVEEMAENLISRIHNFTREKVNLQETKANLAFKGQILSGCRNGVFLRKKQLISELLQIYPLTLVEGSKRFSINGVQLPNAEEYGNEGGGQISVALGYTSHLVAMLAFFLDIPCRYPIRHLGSRSRITDHITVQIPDKEREFPLYFKGKKDVYCAYAVYLLNKNIAQLRWYCGLSTPDLRASLPNLVELLTSRLVIPGWPPNLGETLEIAQEITEEDDSQFLDGGDISLSLDEGIDKLLSNESENSYSKEESPGMNSAALGEIQHGRGQDRFLSGWKKKTYIETDDFDPKWLLDSMNLDFDTGRRFSFKSHRSSPPPHPTITVSDQIHQSRRRRVGQVEPPHLNSLGGNKVEINNTPAENMMKLEQNIREYERRKSRVGVPSGSPVPNSKESSVQSVTFPSSYGNLLVPPPSDDNWITDEEKLSDNNGSLQDGHSQLQVKHSEVCSTGYHVAPPVSPSPVEEFKTLASSIKIEIIDDKDSIPIIDVQGTEDCNWNRENEIHKMTLITTEEMDECVKVKTEEKCKEGNSQSTSQCDTIKGKSDNDIKSNESVEEDKDLSMSDNNSADSSLWMRTEALLGSQSFNLVRRRLSTSEST